MNKLEIQATALETVWAKIARLRIKDVENLAPYMQESIEDLQFECKGKAVDFTDSYGTTHTLQLDVLIFETLRTDELQQIYFKQGTTRARTADWSWHKYGLAFDCISRRYEWFGNSNAKIRWDNTRDRNGAAYAWFNAVADIAKRVGLDWGGDWKNKDLPHFQWGRCAASPSQVSINAYRKGGPTEVWKLVGAC